MRGVTTAILDPVSAEATYIKRRVHREENNKVWPTRRHLLLIGRGLETIKKTRRRGGLTSGSAYRQPPCALREQQPRPALPAITNG